MEIIQRENYIGRILDRIDKGVIIFLTGQRRIGKSCLLLELRDSLEALYPDANILYINKELYEYRGIANSDDLYEYVCAKTQAGERNYLLIDEVQDIESYEDALRSLHAEGRCQIIATGSNAYVFSSELGTRLSGRYIEIHIYPLSYTEFLRFHRLEDSDDSLWKYIGIGGLPGLRLFDVSEEIEVRDYLQGVYSTIMMKDVVERGRVRNLSFLDNLVHFMADNIGKQTSVRNISNKMKSQGQTVSEMLVSSYISLFCNALILTQASRYDIHGKRIFEQNCKYYFGDVGLRNFLCGFNIRGSVEKIIENIIFNRLRQTGHDVYVGELRNAEVDFVAIKGDERMYIQAAYLLASEETVEREFAPLASIRDNYPKYVISADPVGGEFPRYPGIKHVRLRDWLKA